MPFNFDYAVNDSLQGVGLGLRHKSNSDGNLVTGEYHVLLPDGRTQNRHLHADHYKGYQAEVRYEGEAKYPEPAPYHAPKPSYHPTPAYGHPKPQLTDIPLLLMVLPNAALPRPPKKWAITTAAAAAPIPPTPHHQYSSLHIARNSLSRSHTFSNEIRR
ncbi:cuticle protein 19-like [Macrobrachium nipponense]|uniref:cuticle protein 19-like n=1 Tax=Macrobrachium nipponense TaxID=159736 RepID=UPI0030C89C21